jgi:hypothetical protein
MIESGFTPDKKGMGALLEIKIFLAFGRRV